MSVHSPASVLNPGSVGAPAASPASLNPAEEQAYLDKVSHTKTLHSSTVYCSSKGEVWIKTKQYLIIGNYRCMKLTQIVKIRVNLSRVVFVEP